MKALVLVLFTFAAMVAVFYRWSQAIDLYAAAVCLTASFLLCGAAIGSRQDKDFRWIRRFSAVSVICLVASAGWFVNEAVSTWMR